MPSFSKRSQKKLSTCDDRLRSLFEDIVKDYDCTILEGHRSPERQAQLYREGKSKVPVSRHNAVPSEAVDVSPYPIPEEWGEAHPKEMRKFYHFAGFVLGVAASKGIDLRWGGDWDGDREFRDQTFDDLVHFELKEKS